MLDNQPAGAGHNQPPAYDVETHEALLNKAKEFGEQSQKWGEAGVTDDASAEKMNDFLTALRAFQKKVDQARVDAKKPWDAKSKEVQDAFKPRIQDPLAKMMQKCKALLDGYLREQQKRLEEQQRREQEEARRKQAEAEAAAAKAAESGNEFAQAEAEAQKEQADAAAAEAAKEVKATVQSASGIGNRMSVRKVRKAVIVNPIVFAGHLAKTQHPDFMRELERIANSFVRAKDVDATKIPGMKEVEE